MAKKKSSKVKRTRWNRSYVPKRKVCPFCANKVEVIDYKDYEQLSGFISDRGKISPRRRTGACAKHQRVLAGAIKRARHLALLPYVPAHVRRVGSVSVGE